MPRYRDDFHVELKLKNGETVALPAGADRNWLVLFSTLTTRREKTPPQPPRVLKLLEGIGLPGAVIADLVGVSRPQYAEWKALRRPIPAARMVQLLGLVVFISGLMHQLVDIGWERSPVMSQLKRDARAFDRFLDRECWRVLPPEVVAKVTDAAARFHRTLVATPEARAFAPRLGASARPAEAEAKGAKA